MLESAMPRLNNPIPINVMFACCLQLAPGGHLGRFIIWTKSAFDQLDSIFGASGLKQSDM